MAELGPPPTMGPRDADPRAGFLLVEALATLTISAFILAALASLIGLMSRQADGLALRIERFDAADRGLATLAREIGSAARVRWAGHAPRPFIFAGNPDHVVFALDRSIGNGLTETIVVSLENTPIPGGTGLLRREAPLAPTVSTAADLVFSEPVPVYAGPAPLRFAYVTRTATDGPEILIDDWGYPSAMPQAVRVGLTLHGSDQILSSLRVPLALEAEPGCVKPKTAFCSRIDASAPPDPDDAPSVASILGNVHLRRR